MEDFEIRLTDSVEENIHRIMYGQIQIILSHCTGNEEDKHKSVHEIRKSLKRIRAVLRLVRDEIGFSTYYRENVFYRDLNRKLSEMRKFNVLIESTRQLQTDDSNAIPESSVESFIMSLEEQRDLELRVLIVQEDIFRQIAKQMDNVSPRIKDWPIEQDGFRVFYGGLRRIFRQGKKFMDLSKLDPTPVNFHDLRKKMKYLWYQILILRPIFPDLLGIYAERLDYIGENLGKYHDYAELQDSLNNQPQMADIQLQKALVEGCELKKTSIIDHIWKTIETIYQENPEDISDRFNLYWKMYLEDHAVLY